MIYPAHFESVVGFSAIRQEIVDRCIFDSSKSLAASFEMSILSGNISHNLDLLDECNALLQQFPSLFSWQQAKDISPWLKYLHVDGFFLEEEELQGILLVLKQYTRFLTTVQNRSSEYPQFVQLMSANDAVKPCVSAIEQVIDEEAHIKLSATPVYQKLSQEINRLEREIRQQTKVIFREWKALGFVADTDVTIREERLVIPVLAEYKRKVQGFVKDISATGKVLFVEPTAILEINNRLKELFAERRREREKILKQLTASLKPHHEGLENLMSAMAEADFVYAKQQVCSRIGAERPISQSNTELVLKQAFHPVLKQELGKQNKKIVPLNLSMDQERVIVVSGPNAGGKSVVLKTALLLQYMYQCGLYICALPDSKLSIFEHLMIDCGDGQSIEEGLSTFSAHLKNLKSMIDIANEKTFIGLDELGTGTDPRYGAPIAQAVLERMVERKSFVIATTHFSQIREWGRNVPSVAQGSMAYDAVHLQPLYTFVMGKPGSSFALELMRKTGFDSEWMERIGMLAGKELGRTEDLMLDLERKTQQLSLQIAENAQRNNQLKQLIEEYTELKNVLQSKKKVVMEQTKKEAQSLLSKANQQIEQTIRIIRENSAEKKKTTHVRKQLDDFKTSMERKLENKMGDNPIAASSVPIKVEPEKPSPEKKTINIIPGSRVKHKLNGQKGEVIDIKKDKVLVVFGLIKMWIPKAELESTQEGNTTNIQQKTTGFNWVERQSAYNTSIDLHGLRAEQSIEVITKWMDEGYALGHKRLKIIHGRGTGALRKAIRLHLKSVNYVKSYENERSDMGGDGCTIIVLN